MVVLGLSNGVLGTVAIAKAPLLVLEAQRREEEDSTGSSSGSNGGGVVVEEGETKAEAAAADQETASYLVVTWLYLGLALGSTSSFAVRKWFV